MALTITETKKYAAIAGVGTASGTDTYTVSIPEVTAYILGMHLIIKFPNGNTSTSSLNVNGLGVKNILKGVTSTLAVNDILNNQMMELAYDGTSFQLINSAPIAYVNSVGNNLFNYYNFR